LPGFYLAAGHGGDGIALSLETGRLLAEAVAEAVEPEELHPFLLARFS
jgi:glycine/D-amino acid oxidase-like deaminating enzyme